jgi:hypothetical protein
LDLTTLIYDIGRRNTSETDKVRTKTLYPVAGHFIETFIPKYFFMNTRGQHSGACFVVFRGIQTKLSNIRTKQQNKKIF